MSTIENPMESLPAFFLPRFVSRASDITAVSTNFTFTGGFLDYNASINWWNASSV